MRAAASTPSSSEHAVVLTSDHAQTPVEHGLDLAEELAEDWRVLQPNSDRPEDAEIAVSPTSRAGAVYLLDTGSRPRRHPRAGAPPAARAGRRWTWSPGSPGPTAPR